MEFLSNLVTGWIKDSLWALAPWIIFAVVVVTFAIHIGMMVSNSLMNVDFWTFMKFLLLMELPPEDKIRCKQTATQAKFKEFPLHAFTAILLYYTFIVMETETHDVTNKPSHCFAFKCIRKIDKVATPRVIAHFNAASVLLLLYIIYGARKLTQLTVNVIFQLHKQLNENEEKVVLYSKAAIWVTLEFILYVLNLAWDSVKTDKYMFSQEQTLFLSEHYYIVFIVTFFGYLQLDIDKPTDITESPVKNQKEQRQIQRITNSYVSIGGCPPIELAETRMQLVTQPPTPKKPCNPDDQARSQQVQPRTLVY